MLTTSPPSRPIVVWFRDDQRLADNPALEHAAASGHPVVCIYVHDPAPDTERGLGAATRWWLHASLRALDADLAALGGRLILLRGPERQVVEAFLLTIDAHKIVWNRRYSAAQREADATLKARLKTRGIAAASFNGHLLHEPWTVTTREGTPYKVFGAYWRAAQRDGAPEAPRPAPARIEFLPVLPNALAQIVSLDELELQPVAPDWAGGLRATWQCGEAAAWCQLQTFLANGLSGYAKERDLPALLASSRLSPYLRFGNISARQVWHAVHAAASAHPEAPAMLAGSSKFLDELGWREFSYYQLYHFAPLHQINFKRQFDAMPWRDDPVALHAWQRGQTGYPLVDAGMRELWHTGWMHNRVRMVAASFLVKHLLTDWRAGEAWFWDTLVDADEASNPANWQWVAGSGADAAPYFRIFNPVLQGEKFDPHGDYVRRWVPELAHLSGASIHAPWRLAPQQLEASALQLGRDYPQPIVPHEQARSRALAALETLRGASR